MNSLSTILFCFGSTTRRIMCSVVVFCAGQELVIDNYCISVHGQIWQSFQQGIVCNVCVCIDMYAMELGMMFFCKAVVTFTVHWCFMAMYLATVSVQYWRLFFSGMDCFVTFSHFRFGFLSLRFGPSSWLCVCYKCKYSVVFLRSHIVHGSVIKITDSCLYNLSSFLSANCIICDW